MVKQVDTKDEYDKILKENDLVAVDYFATWCGPCKMISPKFEQMEKDYTNVVFIKVDVDKNSEVAEQESVSAMPTFKFFKKGTKKSEVVGASEKKLKEALEKLIKE